MSTTSVTVFIGRINADPSILFGKKTQQAPAPKNPNPSMYCGTRGLLDKGSAMFVGSIE